jgi:uncharacterized protein YhfF
MAWLRMHGLRTLELGTPGAMRRELTELVLAGVKRATAGLVTLDYEAEGEPLEHLGERLVLVDENGAAAGIIQITGLDVIPFAKVSDDFARAEGEGFAGHDDWAVAHRAFWTRAGEEIDDATPVVCVRFTLLPDQPGALPDHLPLG